MIDLHFDWPLFARTCHEELVPATKVYCSESARVCPINDFNTDLFKFVLYILEQAAKSEAEGMSAAQKKVMLAPLKNIIVWWGHVVQEVSGVQEGKLKTWKGDVALVKLMERCGLKEFF